MAGENRKQERCSRSTAPSYDDWILGHLLDPTIARGVGVVGEIEAPSEVPTIESMKSLQGKIG